MTGGSDRARRRVISLQEERYALRQMLVERYRADGRYQAIVRQDLVPLWRAFETSTGWNAYRSLSWPTLVDLWENKDAADPAPDSLRAYVSAIVWTVATTLGLTESGYPSSWALDWVHEDVAGGDRELGQPARSPRARDDDLLVSLDFTPNVVGVRYYAQGRRDDPYDEECDLRGIGIGYGSDHWAALKAAVTSIVEDAVDEMQREIESRYPWRNPSHIANWPRDVDALRRTLFHDERPTNNADAARLRRIAERAGIDPPTRRRAERDSAVVEDLLEALDTAHEGAA